MNKIKDILRASLIALLSFGIVASASLNFVQTPTTALYSSLSTTGTSMRVTPYPVDLNGTKLTMTDFGTTPTATIDPKVRNYEEIVSFTGITDNGDSTATLTGLSRNYTSKSPYTTTGTGKQHNAGAIVVFSNNPQMYARMAVLENNQTFTGTTAFNIPPILNDANATSTAQAASRAYANSLVAAGVATSSETNFGGVWLATQLQMASSTNSVNAPAVLYSKYSTSTPSAVCGLCIPITQNNGKLHQSFLDLTQNFSFSGNNTYSGTQTITGLTSLSATTTMATTTQNGAMFGGNIVNNFTGGQTIAGTATPIPIMIATSTGYVYTVDGDVASTTAFIGFVINSCSAGTTCYVQTAGIVKGFTGLTTGAEYFVSDTAGVLATTAGTAEQYVGRAVSSSQILIDSTRQHQYLGSQASCDGTANTITVTVNQPFARFAEISGSGGNTSGDGFQFEFMIEKKGHNSPTQGAFITTHSTYSGANVTWTGNSIACDPSGNSGTATIYYYR